MTSRVKFFALPLLTVAGALAFAATGASALTVAECSAKYKAAKAADTLAGKTWNEFRAAECTDAAAATETKPAAPKPAEAKVSPKPATTAGGAVFPTAISTKYAKETAGKARMHTCRDQYHANKATNANGGLRWIQKGGGYYSECNKHLKGSV